LTSPSAAAAAETDLAHVEGVAIEMQEIEMEKDDVDALMTNPLSRLSQRQSIQ
jgi:hypothetical protein